MAETTQGSDDVADKRRRVMVVFGRDAATTESLFDWLRTVDLRPQEWEELVGETDSAAPYIGDVLDSAMDVVQAVVVLFTPDDLARLRPELMQAQGDEREGELKGQPRANVLFEAGMAFGRHPRRTILVEHGDLRGLSDLGGRNAVRLERGVPALADLARRLLDAGCAVNLRGTAYLDAGRFPFPGDHAGEDGKRAGDDGDVLASPRQPDIERDGNPLERLLAEILLARLAGPVESDVVEELARRLRGLERPIRRSELFDGLPGHRIPNDLVRQIVHDLAQEGVLKPNPDTRVRGYVVGELPGAIRR